jgi:hypothetical protein
MSPMLLGAGRGTMAACLTGNVSQRKRKARVPSGAGRGFAQLAVAGSLLFPLDGLFARANERKLAADIHVWIPRPLTKLGGKPFEAGHVAFIGAGLSLPSHLGIASCSVPWHMESRCCHRKIRAGGACPVWVRLLPIKIRRQKGSYTPYWILFTVLCS